MVQNIVSEIHKLQSYNNSPYPILSTYLTITDEKDYAKIFRELVTASLPSRERSHIEEDMDYVNAYLQQYSNTRSSKGIAIFSGGHNLWEVVSTQYPLPNQVFFDHSPYLEPILEELDEYKRYAIVLTDRQRARFYTLYLGTIEMKEDIEDKSVPQKAKGRGATEQQNKRDRHIQDHLHKHFDLIAHRLDTFIQKKPLAGVVIGGHKESLHVFEKHLPKHLKNIIIGEFVADTDLDQNAVVAKSKEVIGRKNASINAHPSTKFTTI